MNDPRHDHHFDLAQSFRRFHEWCVEWWDAGFGIFLFVVAVATFVTFLASGDVRYLILTGLCFFMLARKQ